MNAEHPNPQAELEARLRFETLIADLSSRFVNLAAGEVDREIMEAERRLCEALDLDISAIWQWNAGPPGRFTLTHYYSAQDGPQPSMQLSDSDFPWFRQLMKEGRVFPIASLEEMPAEAAVDRENARRLGIKSNLCLPLMVGGEAPVGILGLNTTRAERDWPDALVKRLQLVAQIFTNALARKRGDQALRQSEERLSLAADCAGAGLWELDCQTQAFWTTEKARALFGYSPGEVISMARIKETVHPDDWALVERSLERSVRAGEPLSLEYRIRLGDGRERWITSRGRPFLKSTGEPDRLLGLSMDITDRKRKEDQVRQLSLAVEQSPVSVVITDTQGAIIYVNRKFSEMSGYPAAECLGQNPRILKSGNCPAATYQALWACITSGRTWRGEFHNRKKNGEFYWEWAVISPLLDAAGKVTHFVGVKEDITERKRTEEALRAAEARLAAGTELAGLGYFEVDYGAGSCFLDDRFQHICGVPGDLNQGLQPVEFWLEHVHPGDRQFVQDQRQKLHDGRIDRISAEYRYQHPAQGLKWLHHFARLAENSPAGPGVRTFGLVRDITPKKKAELEALELRNNLAHAGRVTVVGQLASALAHELSQPLGAILRNAEAAEILLEQAAPDLEELRAIVTDILRDDQRAGQVIDRLRSLLKRRSLDLQPIDLPGVIAEVQSLVRADAAARQVKLACSAEPGLPLVQGDRIHLQQVLLNLLLNAMDALAECPANQPSIQVSAAQTDAGTVEVRVSDNGPGIPGELLERLFEAFYTTKAKGLGLGLAVSKTLIEAHHGRLWAENRPGGGACFCFTLPVSEGNKGSVISDQ